MWIFAQMLLTLTSSHSVKAIQKVELTFSKLEWIEIYDKMSQSMSKRWTWNNWNRNEFINARVEMIKIKLKWMKWNSIVQVRCSVELENPFQSSEMLFLITNCNTQRLRFVCFVGNLLLCTSFDSIPSALPNMKFFNAILSLCQQNSKRNFSPLR